MSKLPEWFDGEVYVEGTKVRNPFSGDEYELNAKELSMYDFIMGAQMIIEMGMTNDKIITDFRNGRDWFRKNNTEAYMGLLD